MKTDIKRRINKPLDISKLVKIDIWMILPSVVALVIYINGLSGDFVHDDVFAIKHNGDVTGKTHFWNLLYNDFWGKPMTDTTSHKSYRPLTVITFRWNYATGEADPFYFHVVNVALHAAVTFLFVHVCRRALRLRKLPALTAGVLFAAHPIHTEAVTGIVGRAEMLAAFFFLLSLIAYVRSVDTEAASDFPATRNGFLFVCSLLSAAAAMVSKETGITTLGVSVGLDAVVCCRRGFLRLWNGKHCSNKEYLPFIKRITVVVVFVVCMMCLRMSIMGGELPRFLHEDNPASFSDSFTTRSLTYSYLWAYNVWLLLAPSNLCYDWQTGSIPLVENILDFRNLATLGFFLVLCAVCWKGFSNFKNGIGSRPDPVAVSLLLTIVPFIPASNLLFTVGFVLAERVLYIPSFGFCLLVSCGVHKLASTWPRHRRPLAVMFLITLLLFSWKTCKQNRVWESRESLFRSGIEVLPHNAKVHYNYANFMKDVAQYDDARYHYKQTISLSPTYASAYNNLGTLIDNVTEAETHFRRTLQLQPLHQGALVNLGNVFFNRGERDEGLEMLQRAVLLDDTYLPALTSAAWALLELGRTTEAGHHLRLALQLDPGYAAAHSHYGHLMSRTGRYEEAVRYYERAHELAGTGNRDLLNAAQTHIKLGQWSSAEDTVKRALDIEKDATSLGTLAVLHYQSGRTDDAILVYQEIYRRFPSAIEYIEQYASILGNAGRVSEATSIFEHVISQSPDSLVSLKNLAAIYTKQDKHNEAIQLQENAIRLVRGRNNETLVQLLFGQANSYKDLQQYDQALKGYREVISLNPAHVHAHANTGTIYHVTGDIEKARYHYEIALKLEPGNTIVSDNLQRLDRLQGQRDQGVG